MMAPRSARTAAAVIVAAIAVGVACGIVVDRLVLLPRAVARFGSGPADPMRWRMRERLAHDLELTPQQQARIDSIMAQQVRAFATARRAIQPRMDSLVESARASMDSVLTPEQRAKLQELRSRNAFGAPMPPWRERPFGRRGPGPTVSR